MAWTAPRTWTIGEFVTKAIMDTHIRDNLLFLKGQSGTVTLDETVKFGAAGKGTLIGHRHPYGSDRHVESGTFSGTDSGSGASGSVAFTRTYGSAPNVVVMVNGVVVTVSSVSTTGFNWSFSGTGTRTGYWIAEGFS